MKNLPSWKTVASKYIVNDRWLKLRADDCITPDGHTIAPYYVFEYGEWVNCVVISDDNEVTLLRHYRYAVDKTVLELVGGMVDAGETPEEAIRRELEEEIGLQGATITATGVTYANPATHTNKIHCFVAQGGTLDGNKEHEAGADFEVIKVPLSRLEETVADANETMQSYHLASIFLALHRLKKNT